MSSLQQAMDEAHGAYARAHRELLRVVADLASSDAWRGDGAGNLAAWLSARYQVAYPTAREWVRLARALEERPALDAAYAEGSISSDQMKALSRLAEPGTDDDECWLEGLSNWPIARLQLEARKAVARELERSDEGRYLRIQPTADERFFKIDGRLHPEEGAALLRAVERNIPSDAPWQEIDQLSADALVAMACGVLGADPDRDRATVVLHVGASEPVASLACGGFVPAAVAERLACDGRIEVVTHDGSGKPVGIGRASRVVPAWLFRQVVKGDGGCVFPGCARTRGVEAHHRVPWRSGGRTDLESLVLLCSRHHALVHEGGWSLRGEPGPAMRWLRPDGSPFAPRAPARDAS